MGSIVQDNVFLIFGNGYIANQIRDILVEKGRKTVMSKARIENREQVVSEIAKHSPSRVINCAGVRDADWCEDHRVETMQTNVLGALTVADVCYQLGIHITYFGSGCIYTIAESELKTQPAFKETDEPFYQGCWYGRSRLLGELSIRHYPNLLLFRVRVPIGADSNPNNHVIKLLKQDKITELAGSSTILPNLLPGAVILSDAGETGVFNLVAPGVVNNAEVMQLAKKHIRPDLTWQTISLEETLRAWKGTRAYSVLDATKLTTKLAEYGYKIKQPAEALEEVFQIMKSKKL